MSKYVEIKFDADAYKEYRELQDSVTKGKSSKKKPTYKQLLTSINIALKNLKANPH